MVDTLSDSFSGNCSCCCSVQKQTTMENKTSQAVWTGNARQVRRLKGIKYRVSECFCVGASGSANELFYIGVIHVTFSSLSTAHWKTVGIKIFSLAVLVWKSILPNLTDCTNCYRLRYFSLSDLSEKLAELFNLSLISSVTN